MPRSGSQGARKRAPTEKRRNAASHRDGPCRQSRHPANTPESFKAALAFPVDYLEADVRFTPENEAYLSHDPLPLPLQRNAMRLKELLKLAASHPKVRLNLDMKEYSGIKEMAALIRRSRMTSRVILTGIDRDVVSRVRGRVDGLPYLLNAHPSSGIASPRRGPQRSCASIRACGALGLNAHYLFVTRRLARALSAAGLSVSVWTVDGEREMRRMLRLPVDNITTNRVDTLLALRNGRSPMNWRGYVHAMGTKRLLEAMLFSVFLLFFYGPLHEHPDDRLRGQLHLRGEPGVPAQDLLAEVVEVRALAEQPRVLHLALLHRGHRGHDRLPLHLPSGGLRLRALQLPAQALLPVLLPLRERLPADGPLRLHRDHLLSS